MIAYAAIQATSLLSGVTIALAILGAHWIFGYTRLVAIFIRRRDVKFGEQLTLAAAVMVAGTWAAYDLLNAGHGGLPWWRLVVEGALLFASVSVQLRLIIAATSASLRRKWLHDHLDDQFVSWMLLLRHHATDHRADWGGRRLTQSLDEILESAAQAVEQHLVTRLGPSRQRDRRRQLTTKAAGIAAYVRARKDDLSRDGGADRMATFSSNALAVVLKGAWLDSPVATVPPARPLMQRIATWLLILVPLPISVVAQSLGLPLAGVTLLTAAWLLANLMGSPRVIVGEDRTLAVSSSRP